MRSPKPHNGLTINAIAGTQVNPGSRTVMETLAKALHN